MAFRCKHELTINVQAISASELETLPIVRASFDLDITWDNSGRQLWACDGWRPEGQPEVIPWDDAGHPLTQTMHALLSIHLTPATISKIVSSHPAGECSVIDFSAQRKLRGLKSSGIDPRPAPNFSSEKKI
ncbi:MAG: hypothetical protein KJ622_06150 [Alphaproteobacteria bacterium]|nr:hypothetical protein [Alphaproteobacteria bacterium]